jgi:hypothetical protein
MTAAAKYPIGFVGVDCQKGVYSLETEFAFVLWE